MPYGKMKGDSGSSSKSKTFRKHPSAISTSGAGKKGAYSLSSGSGPAKTVSTKKGAAKMVKG